MAHSVELLFDPDTEAAIRHDWETLAAAGLPSLAHHQSPTNRPHVTLTAAARIDPGVDDALAALAARLPVPCRIGAPVVFGRRTLTLVRSIVPTSELLAVHAAVDAACLPLMPTPPYDHTRPGQWTAHVTLARRMTGPELVEALAAIGASDVEGSFTGLRRWDGDAKVDRLLGVR